MVKKQKSGMTHRAVIECDKAQFNDFRARLLQKYGMTVSNWFRNEMDKELKPAVQGKFKTKYLR